MQNLKIHSLWDAGLLQEVVAVRVCALGFWIFWCGFVQVFSWIKIEKYV